MEVPSEEPTAEEEMISSDMDDLDDPLHSRSQALAFEDPRPGGSLTADSQSLGLGSPPPLATGLFRGRFAGESESPSMASELESGRPSPAADSLEQAQRKPGYWVNLENGDCVNLEKNYIEPEVHKPFPSGAPVLMMPWAGVGKKVFKKAQGQKVSDSTWFYGERRQDGTIEFPAKKKRRTPPHLYKSYSGEEQGRSRGRAEAPGRCGGEAGWRDL